MLCTYNSFRIVLVLLLICLKIAICSKETAKDSWPEFEVLYELLNKLESLQEPQLCKWPSKTTSVHLYCI